MSTLSSTAEEILALVEGPRVHHDPKVCREILKTDIENAINQYVRFSRLGWGDDDFHLRTMILTNRS